MGVASPMVMEMSVAPVIAQKRAQNFGVAESAAVTYAASAQGKHELPTAPPGCTTTNEQENTYMVTCSHGTGKYVASVSRAFSLMDSTGTGLGIYADDDRDGFDDVTGLMTHYAECYSGWKGTTSNSLKNNCDVGGRYVIPAYAFLYQ